MAEGYTWVISQANVTATTAPEYRKSNPDSKGLAPHRITDTQELWVAPLNHNGSIGNFLVKLYMGPRTQLSALRDEGATCSAAHRWS